LISLEENKNIPFDIKRVYYILILKAMSEGAFMPIKNSSKF